MPKVIKKRIWWNPVTGSDVVNYKVRIGKDTDVFDYAMPAVTVPAVQTDVVAPDAFPAGTFADDTTYKAWITAIDDAGNESDPLVLTSPFDFVAPPAPSEGGVSDI